MKWKISISENAIKYGLGIFGMLIIGVIGVYFVIPTEPINYPNIGIGMFLIVISGFIGYLVFRTTRRA
ncbi:hypothetical protein LBMAG54_05300 [Nitrosopumilaceae archaeon]|nr:hypothetical protein EMGBD3_00840 [Nitrosarchaeum sp.]GDY15674.1 hypothetical protein LBMAG54_05300 [Nitrosopumilaceae archaeon]